METTPHESQESPPAEPLVPFRITSLLVDDGKEPVPGLTDGEASAAWCASTSPWHPALLAISDAAKDGSNVMEFLVDAAKAGATLGEICGVFAAVFGDFAAPSGI